MDIKAASPERASRAVLARNIEWFQRSGVMDPPSGAWGVGERVVARDNLALDKILSAFPYYTVRPAGYILEHRRPDCNFQTAWLFTVAAEALDRPELAETAENIVAYLYTRSGLLNKRYPDLPKAAWEWSSNNLKNQFYYDDNGWNLLFSLLLARRRPALDKRHGLRQYAMELADTLAGALEEEFFEQRRPATIVGRAHLPHFGAPACAGIAAAGGSRNAETVRRYFRYLDGHFDTFNTSEWAYALLGGSVAAAALGDGDIRAVAERAANRLLERTDADGLVPSEHYETPNGNRLVDLVYTVNWAALGFQTLASISENPAYGRAFGRLRAILEDIQDRSDDPLYRGCWRGLYDRDLRTWSGGDLHEGGSGSVYTGWTNAPIAIALAYGLAGGSLALEATESGKTK